jgi:hypothetical protein
LKTQVQNALQCNPIWFTEIDASENVQEEEEKYEFNNSPEVIDNLSPCHRRKYFSKNMLERFREETGQLEAKYINWKLLDKSRLPSQYHGIKIDSHSILRSKFFKDIVDNIHFKPYTAFLEPRKTSACIDDDNPEIDASENVLEEEEKYEFNNPPEVIDNLSACHRRKYISKNMLKRFREETGQLEAKHINWKLLDKSRLPSQYHGKIVSHSILRTKFFINNVDNIHFKPCTDDRPSLKKLKINACIDDDNSEVDDSENDQDFDIDDIKEKEKYEIDHSPKVIKNLSARPSKIEQIRPDYKSFSYESSDSDYDEEVSTIINSFYDFHNSLETQVQSALQFQCSSIWFNENYSAKNESEDVMKEKEKYEIDHSPKVIKNLSARPSKIEQIRPIRCNTFRYRQKRFRGKMLKRFRKETGQQEAKVINWKLLDRSRIPSEYDGIKIDSILMMKTEYFENFNIVDNIHFKPCTDNQPALKECNSNIDPLEIKMRLLEIFRIDSDRPNAPKIIWDRIDSDQLPEKY